MSEQETDSWGLLLISFFLLILLSGTTNPKTPLYHHHHHMLIIKKILFEIIELSINKIINSGISVFEVDSVS